MNLLIRINYKLLSLILIVLLLAAAGCGFFFIKPGYRPSFYIEGDVQNVLKINSMDGYTTHTAYREDGNFTSLKLSELLESAVPLSEDYKIAIRGSDGLISVVEGSQTEGMYVTFTVQNGWEMINEFHPPSSNIKKIDSIWVVSSVPIPDYSVSVISDEDNIAMYSPGQLFMSETYFSAVFQGQSVRDNEFGGYDVSVYTEKRYKLVSDIAPEANDVLVMGIQGQCDYDPSPGKIVLSGNTLQYIYSDGRTLMDGVRGILINPPSASNMDAYNESVNNLDAGNRVLVVLMDGFGYHQYEYAVQNGYAPYLASVKPAKQATSEYLPVTNTGTAAILTGQPPYANGIWDHGMSELKCSDIFAYVAKEGKTAANIEGNVNILNTSLKTALNADRNGDNSTDDEIFESAHEAIAAGTDYVFVHCHGIDDTGHNYGVTGDATLAKIKHIDESLAQLAKDFHGTVIITADHGMHNTQDGGDHGEFRNEDMIIPYISYFIS